MLKKLCESGVAFEAVADLCEMAARKDPVALALMRRIKAALDPANRLNPGRVL